MTTPLARVGELSGQLTPGNYSYFGPAKNDTQKAGKALPTVDLSQTLVYEREQQCVLLCGLVPQKVPSSASSAATRTPEEITCSTVSSILGVVQG